MKRILNETKRYVNQYFDVKDIISTPKFEPSRTCNISCVAMITGEDPNDVLKWFFDKYGKRSDKFQWQELLINYLKDKGLKCHEILSSAAYPEARFPSLVELEKMRNCLDEGSVIFYHLKGHYQLMIGYIYYNDDKIDYIFNDPAGNRQLPRKKRGRESGHMVVYPEKMVLSEKIYGQCFEIGI